MRKLVISYAANYCRCNKTPSPAPNVTHMASSIKTLAQKTSSAQSVTKSGALPHSHRSLILARMVTSSVSWQDSTWSRIRSCGCSVTCTKWYGVRCVLAASVSFREVVAVSSWSVPCASTSSAGIVKINSILCITINRRTALCEFFCCIRLCRWWD